MMVRMVKEKVMVTVKKLTVEMMFQVNDSDIDINIVFLPPSSHLWNHSGDIIHLHSTSLFECYFKYNTTEQGFFMFSGNWGLLCAISSYPSSSSSSSKATIILT